jgi:hypothetical protein
VAVHLQTELDILVGMRFLATMLLLMPLCAQPPQDAPKKGRPEPKNLKILKAGPDLIPTMQSYTVALGVKCDFCHMGRDFASDDNPKKLIARTMIGMAQDVNAKFPDGKVHVTCYTCHRGKNTPDMAPPPAQ